MNLLVLTPLVPYPPHDGDKLRFYHFLRHLKARGHVIDLVCLTRVKADFQYEIDLRQLCRHLYLEHLTDGELALNLLGGALMGQSLNVSSHFSPRLRDTLGDYWRSPLGRSVDVVLAHRLRTAPAAFEGNPGKPVVLELTDCLTAYAEQLKKHSVARFSRRLAAWWDYWFLKREEEEWGERAFKTCVVSEVDARALRELGLPAGKIAVIPNGVEAARKGPSQRPQAYPPGAATVCFVGNMGYAANEDGALWFLDKVWPRVRARVPGAVFAAVGGRPRKVLQKRHNGRDVRVTGWVPEVEPYFTHSTVSVAPLRVAAGMQNKVALALGLGVPVVATPQAVSWMPPEGRDGVIVAGEKGAFADGVVGALLNPRAARAFAARGRKFILRNYQWGESGRKLEEILEAARKASP